MSIFTVKDIKIGDKSSTYYVLDSNNNWDLINLKNIKSKTPIYHKEESFEYEHSSYELYKDYKKINCREDYIYSQNIQEIAKKITSENKNETWLVSKKSTNKEQNPNHQICAGYITNTKNAKEKTICRCMFHFARKDTECNKCGLEKKWLNNSADIKICEYEYPTNSKWTGVGGIDLVLKYKNKFYATEVKPPKSRETLCRMFAEILTYTHDADNLKKILKTDSLIPAICFFEGSLQEKDFEKYSLSEKESMDTILKAISVFRIKTEKPKNGIINFEIEPITLSE